MSDAPRPLQRARAGLARVAAVVLFGFLSSLGSALAPAPAAAQPLWELGLGAGGLVLDDYRGSTTAHAYPVPVPYVIYRGRFLRSDRQGVEGRFLQRYNLELDLSLSAAPPVFSHGSGVRRGMPDLDTTLELGPRLSWHLWRAADQRMSLDLDSAIRSAITLSAPPRAIGWIFAEDLNVDARGTGWLAGWRFGALGGPLFATRAYHEYFYEVAPRYATLMRPAFVPAGGYSGSELLLSASRRYRSHWFGLFLRHDWLQGAAFIDSPLVQQRDYWAGGIAIVWILAASSREVTGGG